MEAANTERSNQLKEEGNSFFSQKKYEEAVDSYSKAIEIEKEPQKLSVMYFNRALSYFKLKKLFKCNRDCEESIKLNHKYLKTHFLRARIQENSDEKTI